MGIRIKQIHIKPGTELWEGIEVDLDSLTDEEKANIDDNGLLWCKVIYIGFDYIRQWFYIYLSEYWPENNLLEILPKLPNSIDVDCEVDEPFYKIEPEEGVIGYDFLTKDLHGEGYDGIVGYSYTVPLGSIWSEYVGKIYLKPIKP